MSAASSAVPSNFTEVPGPPYELLLLSIRRARKVGHRHTIVDRFAAHRLGLRLLLGRVEYFEHDIARNEAHAGIVGEHDISGRHANLTDLDGSVDFHRLEAPLAGDRSEIARP